MKVKRTRGCGAGKELGNSLIEFIHLMYNKDTARRVLGALVERLQERRKEFDE